MFPQKNIKTKQKRNLNRLRGELILKRSLIVIVILGITVLAIVFGVLTADSVVVEINGEAISRSLFIETMASIKSDVINEYSRLDGTSTDPLKNADTINLLDYWKKRALDECIKTQVLLDYGYESNLTFLENLHDLRKQMDVENELRQNTVKQGGIIYGVTTFSFPMYKEYVTNNLNTDLRTLISQDTSICNNEALLQFYEENKYQIAKQPAYSMYLCYSSKYENEIERNEIKKALLSIHSSVSGNNSLEQLSPIKIFISADSTRINCPQELIPHLQALSIHEYSEVIDLNSSLYLLYFAEHHDESILCFDEAESLIKEHYAQKILEAEISRRIDDANVKIHALAMWSISWEDI